MSAAALATPHRRAAPVLRRGGPLACTAAEGHEFSAALVQMANVHRRHDAAQRGVLMWTPCAHCSAWVEYAGATGPDTDTEDEALDHAPDHAEATP